MAGRSVRLYLVDGTPQGMRTAEVGNWTGLALVCPRTDLVKLAKRDAVRGAGVYLLLAASETLATRLRVYVGEADDVWARLQAHDSRKDWWTWVIVFVSKDENLTKAHVRWLEARLAQDINTAKRADIENNNEPGGGHLPEADAADMEAFLENIRLLLPTLGADVLGAPEMGPATSGLVLELTWEDAHAECSIRESQFVITKGSSARPKEVPSLSAGYRDLRIKLRQDGVLAERGDGLLHFALDYPFDSPSAAASMVTGTNVNGRMTWKVKGRGITYKEWQEQQVGTPDEE